ncbi:MAG: GNAT family N-acetyltransferase [Bacteroidetes bacterium]|nr:GNAT family N-acetyltransferase [Bacteroidota bacterium]
MIRLLHADDKEKIVNILISTKFFTDEEVEIAKEILDIFIDEPNQKDYLIYVSEENNIVEGYVNIGKTPGTFGTFDLYWIAVDPEIQGKGVGTKLLDFAKNEIKNQNGTLIISETSSTEKYFPTQKFYEAKGFIQLAKIKNYYKQNDDLIIYGHYLQGEN